MQLVKKKIGKHLSSLSPRLNHSAAQRGQPWRAVLRSVLTLLWVVIDCSSSGLECLFPRLYLHLCPQQCPLPCFSSSFSSSSFCTSSFVPHTSWLLLFLKHVWASVPWGSCWVEILVVNGLPHTCVRLRWDHLGSGEGIP